MKINKIKITNFKSIYGTQEFDFNELNGMIKLSGPIGSGKTSLLEAILFGLYGTIKDHKNPNLIAWNTKDYKVELWLTSGKHDIYISRSCYSEMVAKIDGKDLQAPSKNDYQKILEEYYDVPRIAIERMCIISFNQFMSLASMNPFQTKCFLDDVFGFKTFTTYNDEVVEEKRDVVKRGTELQALIQETSNQIESLKKKKENQQQKLATSIDITGLDKRRNDLIEQGKSVKQEHKQKVDTIVEQKRELEKRKSEFVDKRTEAATLGKQQKQMYEKFKSGKCPTCGHDIEKSKIDEYLNKMNDYAKVWHDWNDKIEEVSKEILSINDKIDVVNKKYDTLISNIKSEIHSIDTKVSTYNSNLKLMKDNFDNLIAEANDKLERLQQESLDNELEQGEWNDLSELFTKSLRYKLLDSMIPHINNSISKYLNKLEQNYSVKFDQEFKCHIFIDNNEKEISYKDLSTGQKKTLDICIIFGILQNVIANVNFNVIGLDELFSNMDDNMKDMMLEMLQTSMANNRTIIIINHGPMPDDRFDHKIRVSVKNKKINKENIKKSLCSGQVIVHASEYEQIF